jgi:hypothetical protein
MTFMNLPSLDNVLEQTGIPRPAFGYCMNRVLGNLLVDERRAHEAGADRVGADAVLGALFDDDLGEPDMIPRRGSTRRRPPAESRAAAATG